MSACLSAHLPLLASAPGGIQKLRGLILELAVRGKLVPQDANDEPASELLKRIATERARLEAEGKVKQSKPVLPVDADEQPFTLPSGWSWVRLGNVAMTVTDGTHHTPTYLPSGTPFISVKDIDGATVSFDDCRYISEIEHTAINQRCNPERGDVLLCRIGTLGRPTIVDTDRPFSLFVSVGLIKLPKSASVSRYLHLVLTSPCLVDQYDQIKAGGSHTNKLNLGDIPTLQVPIPPLAEQHRIVAKVDELMALCDRLEAEQADAASAHAKLVDTLLGTLTKSRDAEEIAANWQLLSQHFDTLFSTEISLDALKQTILQLAVMGKLVPQDTNERTVYGKLGDCVAFLNGYAFKSEWFCTAGIRLLRNANVGHSVCDWKDTEHLPIELFEEFQRFALREGDLVLSLDRPIITTGLKMARISSVDLPCLLLQRVAKVIPKNDAVTLDYLYCWFNSPLFMNTINPGRSNGVPHISTKQVAELPFVRYSKTAQHRIVAKVDELMALCDRLKSDLAESRARQARLASTLIESALNAA